MERKLYFGIMTPGMVLTLLFGIWMLTDYAWELYRREAWLHAKLTLIVLLVAYHLICGKWLFDFAQAEAYSRRFAFMSPVVLPRGIVDLAQDRPPQDVHLVAPTAMLVAREHVHPALVQLLVQAAHEVHGGAGWFQHKGDFPNTRNSEFALASEAERVYRNGVPWLQRYLPFWFANLFDRMWVALISIVAVLIPLSRVVPPLYQFRIRSRVFRWYAQLRRVEEAIGERPADDLLRELDGLEARIERVTVPLSYADELYSLRGHVAMVRRRLLDGSVS
jgi:hypothetical protein